jgi:polygalacturonase
MRVLRFYKTVLIASALAMAAYGQTQTDRAPEPKAQPALRRSVTEFGAVADGKTLNTAAIQRAIDALAAEGGGVLEIPAGVFRSGSIFLKQGVDLYLADGAVLLGSNNIEDYPKLETRIEGHFEPWRMGLVNAQHMQRVRISGAGKLDGNGIMYWAAFWQRRKENPKCTNLEVERPRLVFIDRCNDVRVEGISLQDSGFWNLHLYRCRDVLIEGLRINAPTRGNILGPSTDGIDVDSSQNVTIRRCHISVNDDNIALKGTKGPLADKDTDSPPVENVLIEDCHFGDGNAALTCGSEATVVRNVTMRNITVSGRNKILMLKLRPDTPQHYEKILIDGVKLSGEGRMLRVAPWRQFFDLKGHPPPSRRVNDITIRNVSGEFQHFGEVAGNPGDTIRNFVFENIDVKLTDPVLQGNSVELVTFKNVTINGKSLEKPTTAPAR